MSTKLKFCARMPDKRTPVKRFNEELLKCKEFKQRPFTHFKFVDGLSWESGDFGDAGSCFWRGRNLARKLLKDAGCKAIQFFRGDKGIGRALLMPVFCRVTDDTWVLFNSYGYSEKFVAELLANYWNQTMPPQPVHISCNDADIDEVIYSNNGGYLLGFKDYRQFVRCISEEEFKVSTSPASLYRDYELEIGTLFLDITDFDGDYRYDVNTCVNCNSDYYYLIDKKETDYCHQCEKLKRKW